MLKFQIYISYGFRGVTIRSIVNIKEQHSARMRFLITAKGLIDF